MRPAPVIGRLLRVLAISCIPLFVGGVGRGQEQDSAPLISVPGFNHGRLLTPGREEALSVLVTGRDGLPLGQVEVLFVAPPSGPGGMFLGAVPEGASFYRTQTDAQGVAAATFVANDSLGVYLVDAVVEGTAAAVSFAMTNGGQPVEPALSAGAARKAVAEQVLLNTVEDETLRLHGPVLLTEGTRSR